MGGFEIASSDFGSRNAICSWDQTKVEDFCVNSSILDMRGKAPGSLDERCTNNGLFYSNQYTGSSLAQNQHCLLTAAQNA